MPKLLVHLWIANRLADRFPCLKNPDFYLGNIAPDAVYSRNTDIKPLKRQTHIVSFSRSWEKDVMHSFNAIAEPSLFELGYYMHIVTDIRLRKAMHEFYNITKVNNKERSYYDRIIVPLAIRKLFDSEQEYRDCVKYARGFTVDSFPFSITKTDIENNFIYADNIFEIKKILRAEDELDIPMPDYKAMCEDTVDYLQEKFMGRNFCP